MHGQSLRSCWLRDKDNSSYVTIEAASSAGLIRLAAPKIWIIGRPWITQFKMVLTSHETTNRFGLWSPNCRILGSSDLRDRDLYLDGT